MLEKLQALAKEIETRLAASLSNHNALLGYAAAINDAIKLASGVVETVAPASPIAAALDATEGVINAVENAETPSQSENQNTTNS